MTSKVILYIAISKDGYIATTDDDVSWLDNFSNKQITENYDNFINTIDFIIMGYRTYDLIINKLSVGTWPYPNHKTFVITHRNISNKDMIIFTNKNLMNLITELKKNTNKNIWICGGANLAQQLLQLNLIDEIQILECDVLLKNGIKLFNQNIDPLFKKVCSQTMRSAKFLIYKKQNI